MVNVKKSDTMSIVGRLNVRAAKKIFSCEPHRVNAKVLEGAVLKYVKALLADNSLVKELVRETEKYHAQNPNKKQIDRLKSLIYGYYSQLEAISERLSQLPKSVSPKFFFAQMEKLEKSKTEALNRDLKVQI